MTDSATVDCASLIAQALANEGVKALYGVVGIPIMKVAQAAQRINVPFYSFRNEQASSYAASAVGFMSVNGPNDRLMPGVSLSCAGPGVIHSLAGIANAWANNWPMLHIACTPKRSNIQSIQCGAFQEAPTIETVKPYVKAVIEIFDAESIPLYIRQAIDIAVSGRPGCVYMEIPNSLVLQTIETQRIRWAPARSSIQTSLTSTLAVNDNVKQALELLQSAQKPLLVIGKGAALAACENELRELVDRLHVPFFPTNMGAGVVPDSHRLNVAHARSTALSNADVILLVGARLNWQLNFGDLNKQAKYIQIDVSAEELISTGKISVAIHGEARMVLQQMVQQVKATTPAQTTQAWMKELQEVSNQRIQRLEQLSSSSSSAITYYQAYSELRKHLPSDVMLIVEGGNTLKIARAMLPTDHARSRVDIGTFATMGLGIGYAIAAYSVVPAGRRVVAIQGDSAFGFSAMEFETAVRYSLPIVFIIINNSGVFNGANETVRHQTAEPNVNQAAIDIPVTALSPQSRYELFASMFGSNSKGWYVDQLSQLSSALLEAFAWTSGPSLINIIIDPSDPVMVAD